MEPFDILDHSNEQKTAEYPVIDNNNCCYDSDRDIKIYNCTVDDDNNIHGFTEDGSKAKYVNAKR